MAAPDGAASEGEILAALRAARARPMAQALSLPPRAYSCPEFHALEVERIFRREWVSIGHVDEIPAPGDYFATDLVGEEMVAVRGTDGAFRVLSNVCRHRCARVAGGRGNAKQLVCPYHGWAYGLDGALRAARFMGRSEDFDIADWRLPAINAELWNGFIYVNLDGDAAPLAPRLAGLGPLIDHYHPGEMRFYLGAEEVWDVNWKAVTENFTENYHTMQVHPGTLHRIVPTRLTRMLDPGGAYHVHLEPYGEEENRPAGERHEDVPAAAAGHIVLVAVFPSATYGMHAPQTFSFAIRPDGPCRSKIKWGIAVRGGLSEADLGALLASYADIIAEDRGILENMQSAIAGRHAAPGRLSYLEQSSWELTRYIANKGLDT